MADPKYEDFIALGGEIVGGEMFIDRKVVGRWNGGVFYIEPGSEEVVAKARERKDNEDTAAKEAAALAEVQAKAAKVVSTPVKVKPPVAPSEPPATPVSDVDAMLTSLGQAPKA